ncbi:MAG TPA: hypothetical protein VFP89_13910 [Propionibacteriaceae bacterium]|nr:hypothetical protein [Propionibacteriaceae bacterium]
MEIPALVRRTNEHFVGRLWALDQVSRWLDDPESPVFLLTGPPGCGKTAFSAWLAGAGPEPDDVESAKRLTAVRTAWAAVHFCSREAGRGSVDPRRFAVSVSSQLADSIEQFASYAAATLAPTTSIIQSVSGNVSGTVTGVGTLQVLTASPQANFENGVHAPLAAMVGADPDATVSLLVDGLDDAYGAGSGDTLVGMVSTLLDLTPNVRLMISCRADDRIQAAFDRDNRATVLDFSAPSVRELNAADVRGYVTQLLATKAAPAEDTRPAIDRLVDASEGNFQYAAFLLREISAGSRPLSDVDELPAGLDALYEANLTRIQTSRSISDDDWEVWFRPLLGLVAVSDPAAPMTELPRWVRVDDDGVLYARAKELEQIMPFEDDLDGWRLFHRSMREFLFEAELRRHGRRVPNRYCVPPGRWHWHIAEYYLSRASRSPGNWSALGSYGLARLVFHLVEAWTSDSPVVDKNRCQQAMWDLVMDRSFREAQRRDLGSASFIVDDARAVLEIMAATGRSVEALSLLSQLAGDESPAVRALAVSWLATLHQQRPDEVIDRIRALLAESDTTAWRVALQAAYEIGPPARSVFLDIAKATSAGDELRRVAGLALTLRWRPEPGNFTDSLLSELAAHISALPSRQNSRLFEFIADVSIAIYINNCENRQVTEQTAALWRMILKGRMHLGLVNHPGMDKLIARVASRVYSRRILETALLADVSDPDLFFVTDQVGKSVARRNLWLLDPAATITPAAEDDLAQMLDAELPLIRVTAAMIICVHAHAQFSTTADVVRRLDRRLTDRGLLWLLLAFSVVLPPMPSGWLDLVEALTRTTLRSQLQLAGQDVATLPTFDLLFMPLGRAYGTAGEPMKPMTELIEVSRDNFALLNRLLRGWGPVGIYHPMPVLAALRQALAPLPAESRQGLVDCLATIRVVHPELTDLFLEEAGQSGLRDAVMTATDLPSVWRYIWWLGLYKNAVHQALHYPQMRDQLLIGGLKTLFDARSTQELVKTFSVVPLQMLRRADYDLLRWTES